MIYHYQSKAILVLLLHSGVWHMLFVHGILGAETPLVLRHTAIVVGEGQALDDCLAGGCYYIHGIIMMDGRVHARRASMEQGVEMVRYV
jgi:hypothetical protein